MDQENKRTIGKGYETQKNIEKYDNERKNI